MGYRRRIVLAPYAQKLRPPQQQLPNPKNYPYFPELITLLKEYKIIQIGIAGEAQLVDDFRQNRPLKEIESLVQETNFFLSVDSFLPHLAHHIGKTGVVLWGQSDPNIFGYSDNLNLLKDRSFLLPNQFGIWEAPKFNPDAFMDAQAVFKRIIQWQQPSLT